MPIMDKGWMKKGNKRRTRPLLKPGEDFYCSCKGESRQRRESRLNTAHRLNHTVRGERERRAREELQGDQEAARRQETTGVDKWLDY